MLLPFQTARQSPLSLTGAKVPLKSRHIWAIRQHLKALGSIRDLAMFNTALDAKLRGCDLVKLRLAGTQMPRPFAAS